MKKRVILVFGFFTLICLFLILHRIWQTNLPLISPIDLIESLPQLAPIFKKPGYKLVFGFLPYWNMKDSNKLIIQSLTHLVYFGVDLNEDGTIKTFDKPREKEPGWNKLNSQAFTILSRQIKLLNKKLILVVTAMDTDQITNLLNSDENRDRAVNSIMSIVTNKQFDGLNIDFEYMGYPDQTTRDNFTKFVVDLSSKCKISNIKCEISIDVFADSAIKNRLYDLTSLSRVVDQVIVMAYDFYRPSSTQSGPVAPLRGKCSIENWKLKIENCLDYDVVTSIGDISGLVPANKIILGVPFYGYQWQTTDSLFLSHTYPNTGQTITYKNIQNLFSDPSIGSLSATWSNNTLTPYLTYTQNDNFYQIHYEDSNSLSLKIDFIHQAKLNGLAIWALGYELPYTNLWETIENNL